MNYDPKSQETADAQSIQASEPLFENIHIRDKAFFKEFYKCSMLRPFPIVLYILTALVFLEGLYFYIFENNLIWPLCLAPILYFILIIAMYFRGIRVSYKRQTELSPDQPTVYTTQFFEDHITAKNSNGTSQEVDYSVAPKCITTKNYALLITKASQSFPIKKDGFTKGTYEEFCDFLRGKGYKIKK